MCRTYTQTLYDPTGRKISDGIGMERVFSPCAEVWRK
jgi:hypothetical protein